MGRPKKETENKKVKISVTLDYEVAEMLNNLVEEKSVVKSKFINNILKKYIESEKNG